MPNLADDFSSGQMIIGIFKYAAFAGGGNAVTICKLIFTQTAMYAIHPDEGELPVKQGLLASDKPWKELKEAVKARVDYTGGSTASLSWFRTIYGEFNRPGANLAYEDVKKITTFDDRKYKDIVVVFDMGGLTRLSNLEYHIPGDSLQILKELMQRTTLASKLQI